VSRIHALGGSIIRTSRANPTVRDEDAADPDWRLHACLESLRKLGIGAITTHRWYLVVAMGRSAGHLALGIGKAAGATLSVLAEGIGLRHTLRRGASLGLLPGLFQGPKQRASSRIGQSVAGQVTPPTVTVIRAPGGGLPPRSRGPE
jgi:6-phosphofructokinase